MAIFSSTALRRGSRGKRSAFPTAPTAPTTTASAYFSYTTSADSTVAFVDQRPRLQLRTVGALLEGNAIDRPPSRADATFKRAPRKVAEEEQGDLYGKG